MSGPLVLLMGVFLALLREPRAEAATRIRPADLGRVLGLDRAPEVKTLRRKLAELAGHGKGAVLQAALTRQANLGATGVSEPAIGASICLSSGRPSDGGSSIGHGVWLR